MFGSALVNMLVFWMLVSDAPVPVHHDLGVVVDPAAKSVAVTDTVTISGQLAGKELKFLLHSGLTVESLTPGSVINREDGDITADDFGMDRETFDVSSRIGQNKYSVVFDGDTGGEVRLILRYDGEIYHPVEQASQEYARGFSTSPGIISEEGVYLGGSSYWIPWFNDGLITFNMTVTLPESWDVVSQGERTLHGVVNGEKRVRWESPEKMEEVYLIAAEFHEYTYAAGAAQAMAFLRTPDENIANKYLETTAQYMEMYRGLVGPYPFAKFALVENFWETGYGMPSFTLLGEKVIRFPFILHSSYPHELLHNWWGNGVYVDFETGNWCEGLTAYMADHLIKEQRGQGAEYRRSSLQRYTDYVSESEDFPLAGFLSRHDASTEAVGYGKCMMMWDMLRERIGDDTFVKVFQTFYREKKFSRAGFGDIADIVSSVTGEDYQAFFDQWVSRPGAPELKLSGVKTRAAGEGYELSFVLTQLQDEDIFDLQIPVAIWFGENVEVERVTMSSREETYKRTFAEPPVEVVVDPQFNVFRRLHHNEIPPSLSKIFGEEKILVLLPGEAPAPELEACRALADIWAEDESKEFEIRMDNEIGDFPQGVPVWIFGRHNLHKDVVLAGIEGFDSEIGEERIRFGKSVLPADGNSFVVAVRHPRTPSSVAVWVTIHDTSAVPGLARKLPHYGKYSYLAFEGDEPTNVAKGQWPAVHSPMRAVIAAAGDGAPAGSDAEISLRKPLARLTPVFSAERIMAHASYLASEELEGRGLGSPGIEKAAAYIEEQFREIGLEPGGEDGGYFQTWEDVADGEGSRRPVRNIIGVLPGTKEEWSGESVIVCAHYDHLGRGWPDVRKGNTGKIHYGADDNASGVAVMLELARILVKNLKPERTVLFIAFTAEENGLKGSRYYAKEAKKYPVEKVMGVLNLDTVGRLGKNKLLVLNSSSAREWKFIFMGSSYVTGIESEMVTQDLDASDQVSFIEAGVPGVQFFSGANTDYHRPADTVDKLDPAGMVKVAAFVREAIVYLAERDEPMSFQGKKEKGSAQPGHPAKQGGRRVSTGSMPDFAYDGEGVRLQNVGPDSPAHKAGLRAGDVIIQVGEMPVANLREYSAALKLYQPGDTVAVKYKRGEETFTTEITLGER